MLKPNFWSWDKAEKGKKVALVAIDNVQHTLDGVITEVRRNKRCRWIDGKPVKSTGVASVTIQCSNGEEITVTRTNPQYQIVQTVQK